VGDATPTSPARPGDAAGATGDAASSTGDAVGSTGDAAGSTGDGADSIGDGADSIGDAAGSTGDRERAAGRPYRILFVCLGNICRSPTAEGVMRALVRDAGLERRIELDSAGVGAWHVGSPPDPRATAAARARGIALEGHARQVRLADFAEFDLLLAMDRGNLRDLRRLAPDERALAKVRLLREFDPSAGGALEVPDPYYGDGDGFEEVLDLVHRACAALLAELPAGQAPDTHDARAEPGAERGCGLGGEPDTALRATDPGPAGELGTA
jgi:protein-tyrosine phosphatase